MNRFSFTRAKRNTAFVVLLVWLFALAAGVANACLLDGPGFPSHAAAAESSGTGDEALHSSDAPCLKVCDDGSKSLPKPQSGLDPANPGPAPLMVIVWTTAIPGVLASGLMADMPNRLPELPIRVRYPRLAL